MQQRTGSEVFAHLRHALSEAADLVRQVRAQRHGEAYDRADDQRVGQQQRQHATMTGRQAVLDLPHQRVQHVGDEYRERDQHEQVADAVEQRQRAGNQENRPDDA